MNLSTQLWPLVFAEFAERRQQRRHSVLANRLLNAAALSAPGRGSLVKPREPAIDSKARRCLIGGGDITAALTSTS